MGHDLTPDPARWTAGAGIGWQRLRHTARRRNWRAGRVSRGGFLGKHFEKVVGSGKGRAEIVACRGSCESTLRAVRVRMQLSARRTHRSGCEPRSDAGPYPMDGRGRDRLAVATLDGTAAKLVATLMGGPRHRAPVLQARLGGRGRDRLAAATLRGTPAKLAGGWIVGRRFLLTARGPLGRMRAWKT